MLIPIKRDVLDMARRVREIDPALCIFFNTKTQKYEVHDLAAQLTKVLSVDRLDARLEKQLRKAKYAHKRVLRELEEWEYERERERLRNLHNIAESLAEDLKWAGKVVSGYGGIQ